MKRLIIFILAVIWLISGCAQFHNKEEIVYEDGKLQKFSYYNESKGSLKNQGDDSAFMDAVDVLKRTDPAALPQLNDLPRFQKSRGSSRPYTGVIKNSTRYDLVVPSLNSDATITIPAHGWIEYTAYSKNFEVTVYSDGKPFYCLTICADPKNYQYACKKYDFIAEIAKEEPGAGKKLKKRRYKKRA